MGRQRPHLVARTATLAAALAGAVALAACDRNPGSTPPTPSTQTGTPKGTMQTDKEGLQVRDPTTSSSGMATTPNSSADPSPSSGAASAVSPTIPGGGLPRPASNPAAPTAPAAPTTPAAR